MEVVKTAPKTSASTQALALLAMTGSSNGAIRNAAFSAVQNRGIYAILSNMTTSVTKNTKGHLSLTELGANRVSQVISGKVNYAYEALKFNKAMKMLKVATMAIAKSEIVYSGTSLHGLLLEVKSMIDDTLTKVVGLPATATTGKVLALPVRQQAAA